MNAAAKKRRGAAHAAEEALALQRAQDLRTAEERGAARVRQQVRSTLEEHRRVVRVGGQQVEVVETKAIEDVLEE